MSLYSSLYASTNGMVGSSRSTEVISQNIANLTTIGFKRSSIAFRDLLSSGRGNIAPTLAGVQTSRLLHVSDQGAVQQTSSTTDAAILGNGLFPVKRSVDSSDENFFFTRNGQFRENALRATQDLNPLTDESTGETSYLRNSAGFYLYGWALDSDGDIVGSQDLDSLVPINIGVLETAAIPTTEVGLSLNLDAAETYYDPHTFDTAAQLPVASIAPAHFSRTVSVVDNAGEPRELTIQFRKIVGPMAHFTSNVGVEMERDSVLVNDPASPTPGIMAGDSMQLVSGANTLNISFVSGTADTALNQVNTLRDLLDVINNFTVGSNQIFEARLTEDGQLLVQSALPLRTINISATSANVLGSSGLNIIQDPSSANYIYNPDFDIVSGGSAYPDQADFPALADTTNPNTQNWWEVSIWTIDPADPDGSTLVEARRGLMNFDGDGALNATPDADGNFLIDLATTPIDFDNSTTADDTPLSIDITNISQFAGVYTIFSTSQNGTEAGVRTGIQMERDGTVSLVYSNGATVGVYRIPVIVFSNVNGLREVSGTAYQLTEESGAPIVLEAGTEGAGAISGSAIENSNVELGDEFGHLIVAQRSFSLNSQVINAIDEMTQTLSQLKR